MPQAELDAARAELRQEQAELEPRLANLEAATTAHDDGILHYRTRTFRVPPVPAIAGLRILVLDRHLNRCFRLLHKLINEEGGTMTDPRIVAIGLEVPATYEALAAEYFKMVKPHTLLDRLFWRFRANPFLDATETEVLELSSFFFGARTRSRVRWRSSTRAPGYLRSTWPPNSTPSRPAIRLASSLPEPHGPGNSSAGIPAAGATTAAEPMR